jgi:predicted ATP-grasp superfamily ATP-dependent carboligase
VTIGRTQSARTGAAGEGPLACVMGDMDLVRPLGLAGIGCAVVAAPGDPVRFSRFTRAALDCPEEAWADEHELVERLVAFGCAQTEPPVLFYQEDRHLRLVSRHRERLGEAFRFVIADAELVEDLADKSRFQALAAREQLPVPRARRLLPAEGATPAGLDLRFPLIVKPLPGRNERWTRLGQIGKALRVDDPHVFGELWPRMAEVGLEILVQELVPGPETRIESYHALVEDGGEIVAEFTGQKIRTYPAQYGHSTAVRITRAPEVADAGREIVRRLALTGVSKLDFKRDDRGALWLLEINPRFSLWHHPAAAAGLNLPAMVHSALAAAAPGSGARLEAGAADGPATARAGVTWCHPWLDARAAAESGLSRRRWLRFALASDTRSQVSLDDPLPFLRGKVWERLAARRRRGSPGAATEVDAGAAA